MTTRESILNEAKALDPQQIKLPLHVLLDEALDVAKNFARYWSAGIGPADMGSEAKPHPGLHSLGASLPAQLGEEILLIRQLVQEAQTQYLLLRNTEQKSVLAQHRARHQDSNKDSINDSAHDSAQDSHRDSTMPSKSDSIERGRFVLGELQATLRWLLQNFAPHFPLRHNAQNEPMPGEANKKLESAAKSLRVLDRVHRTNNKSAAALLQALHDYAALARPLRHRLDGLGGFDARLIDEAEYLSQHLPTQHRGRPAPSPVLAQAKLQRDQLASLLQSRVQQVRAAARFVFRKHKDIVRDFSSAHQRKLRQRRLAKKRAAGE